MASIVRPTMLRQTGLVAASKRAFSSTNLTSHLVNKPSACTFTRTRTPVGSVLTLASIRVAAFHASVKRSILTPLPREFLRPALSSTVTIANYFTETINGTGMKLP